MEKKSPLISVIVPVYNGEAYLEKCIESLENQTYENLESLSSTTAPRTARVPSV